MYNKLFEKILDSSIWLQPTPIRIVWITLLAAMDEDGYAHFSALQNLADRAKVTLDEARAAVDCFMSPDPDSGNQDYEGRRLERIPGGYIVLNAAYHRAMVSREIQKIKTRERVQRFREKQKDVTQGNDLVTPSEAVSESESETIKNNGQQADRFPDFWKVYPAKRKKKEALKVWKAKNLDSRADELINDVKGRLEEDHKWRNNFIPDPTTYLRGERWDDEITPAPELHK